MKLLYVDDEEVNRFLFERGFPEMEIAVAADGVEALEMLEKDDSIQIVITDYRMPVMDGLEFAEKMKSVKPNLPCFLLTAYQKSDDIKEAMEKEVIDEFFEKPLNISSLKIAIEKYRITSQNKVNS